MALLQPINDLSNDDLVKLIDSIDYVFLDIDGVLIHDRLPINGSIEGVAKLRELGKRIGFVSNNTIYPLRLIATNLKPFKATEDEIVVPNAALLSYLKKIGFNKDIYVISCALPKQQLREAGYNIIEYKDICPHELEEHLGAAKELSLKVLEVCKNVGAVYVDFDINLRIGGIQVAKIILRHIKDVIFLTGMNDDTAPLTQEIKCIMPQFYIDSLERWSKIKSTTIAKPSLAIKEVLDSRFNVSDDSRVLFIGDNVATDIALGVNSGYKTFLVYSGVISKSQVENWKFPEKYKPNYVAENLGELYEKIKDF